jgi:hypothetical protein
MDGRTKHQILMVLSHYSDVRDGLIRLVKELQPIVPGVRVVLDFGNGEMADLGYATDLVLLEVIEDASEGKP